MERTMEAILTLPCRCGAIITMVVPIEYVMTGDLETFLADHQWELEAIRTNEGWQYDQPMCPTCAEMRRQDIEAIEREIAEEARA